MPDRRAQRSHAIFMRALDMDTSERAAFVADACAGDTVLQLKVERLIDALQSSGDYLEAPALGSIRPPTVVEPRRVSVHGYRVTGVIGAGGMATVFEAIQEQPERQVALKVMSRALSSASAVRRFRYETEVLARLRHPGIAPIYETGMCDDGEGHAVPYFAMEFIEGARPLTAYAREEGLTLERRLEMFAAVCDAVQHAHQLGVIHRDLKPGNILVGADGRSRIIDFGVARSLKPDQQITLRADAGQLVGTLNYMSPEQCEAGAAVDVRADVYSLGVVLYELLAGRQPYDLGGQALPAAIRTIREEMPARLGQIVPALRGDLEAIVCKAMAKRPESRYASAGMLAEDVRRFLRHQPVEARQRAVLHDLLLFARRHRVLVGAAGVLLAVLLGSSAAIGTLGYRAARESQRRLQAEQDAVVERDAALRQAYIAGVGGAYAAIQLGEMVQARRRLANAPAALRQFEWHLASALTDRGERTLATHDDLIYALSATPDGARVAVGLRLGCVEVYDVDPGTRVFAVPEVAGGTAHSVALSRDGEHLFLGSGDGRIHQWEVSTGRYLGEVGRHESAVLKLAVTAEGTLASASIGGEGALWDVRARAKLGGFEDQSGGVRGVAVSTDGSRLMTWGRSGTIVLRDGNGVPLGTPDFDFGGLAEVGAISDDLSMIAAGGDLGRTMIWRVSDGELLHTIETPPLNRTVRGLAFSPDGRWLASGQAQVTFWDTRTGERHSQFVGHEDAISGIWFFPDGERLISASWDGTIRVWDVDSEVSSAPLRIMEGHEGQVLGAAFSHDGELIASGSRDGTVRLWEPRLGTMLAALREHDDSKGVLSVSFSPDGRFVASGSEDGRVRLWRTSDGGLERVLGSVGEHAQSVWSVDFSPDGTRIAAAGEEGVLRVWDLRRSELADQGLSFRGHEQRIVQVAFSPEGRVLGSTSRDGTARLWDASTGQLLFTLGGDDGHKADVFAIAFSPDGTRVYTGSRDRTVGVWDRSSGEHLEMLDAHGHFVTSLAVSPDGMRLMAGTWFGEVMLWDLQTHDLVASFRAYNSAIRSIRFAPDGSGILCGGHDHTLHLYEVHSRGAQAARRVRATAAAALAGALLDGVERAPGGWGGGAAHAAVGDTRETVPDDAEIARWVRHLSLQRAAGGQE